MSRISRSAPRIEIDVTEDQLTGRAGFTFLTEQAERFGLMAALRSAIRIKKRHRGASDADMLWSLIASLAAGQGHLSDVDTLRCDPVARQLLALSEVPDSRRLGEYLARFTSTDVGELSQVASSLAQQIAPKIIKHELDHRGYVPVFIDGSAIEVDGHLFESTAVGYSGDVQYWLHTAFVGGLWVAGSLHPGNVDVAADWREQLDEQVRPLLSDTDTVWLRADNAYYRSAVVEYCQSRGWDYSISVTNDNNKAPVLSVLEDLSENAWEDIGLGESATWSNHQPSGWSCSQHYVVIRKMLEDKQQQLFPAYTVILVSRNDLSLAEVIRRHRGKQGQENALKGPLIEMGLHHPPMRSFQGNQAFYLCGQIAQMLLRSIQYHVLPDTARRHGLRPLIRYLICSVARLVKSGRRYRLYRLVDQHWPAFREQLAVQGN